MKQEKKTSKMENSQMSKNKDLSELTDDEILEGFKNSDGKIVKEYFYGYCRVAYCVYDKRYNLRSKPGMDFYSLVHEYYLYLGYHQFKPLEDRKPTMTLKTWMVNGFRFLLLDKLKGVKKEHLFESFEERQASPKQHLYMVDSKFYPEFCQMIRDICLHDYGRDSKNSIILQMLYIDGFKGKEVGSQLGMSASAVTQRTNKMMHEVIIPYFKRYFVASDYEGGVYGKNMMSGICGECAPCPASSPASNSASSLPGENRMFNNQSSNNMEDMKENYMEEIKTNRITPEWIDSLKDNEIFVFGSNLQGMHGGGAARVARLRFGAILGQGVGLQGQSYAIPTMQGGVETIRPYVDDFIAYAQQHPDKQFLVTPIGCGIAGFEPEDIAPLFEGAKGVKNISLPESFWEVIE